MISAGLDIGSRSVKLIIVEDREIIHSEIRINSFDPLQVCTELIQDHKYDSLTATGYGRHLASKYLECKTITEIKAFSLGARAWFPQSRTILDIGGQDIKAISLDQSGKVSKFEMNDRCSAGTGKFLEIMAGALGCRLNEFSDLASNAKEPSKINSMCTVFAESEVISLLTSGARREEVALGIHHSVASKAKSMLNRVGIVDDLVFAGGVALNNCLSGLLEHSINRHINIPDNPQLVGAYGCAISVLT